MNRARASRARIVARAKGSSARNGVTPAATQAQSAAVPVRTRPPTGPPRATLEHALLGMLAESPGMSGYDLMKLFDLSMSHYWHAYQGQIYPTLERMADFGIIKGRTVSKGGRKKRRIYTIAPSGLRLLVEWLESTFEEVRLKHPPLLRCRFLGHLGADGARGILQEEREAWARHLAVYRSIEKDHFGGGKAYRDVAAMFSMFTLRRGIDWMVENIAWCDWAMAEIEHNRALFPAVSTKEALPPLIPFDPIVHGRA